MLSPLEEDGYGRGKSFKETSDFGSYVSSLKKKSEKKKKSTGLHFKSLDANFEPTMLSSDRMNNNYTSVTNSKDHHH